MSGESSQGGLDHVASMRHFHVRCDAAAETRFSLDVGTVCVTVGQRVLRNGVAQMWDSVSIYADQDCEGNLVVRVYVFNPDWDKPLRIARICSRPRDSTCPTVLSCNLDDVTA